MLLLAIPFGLAIGLAVGTLGGGGSVLAVPILVYVLGQTVPEATTASLVVVAAGAVAGGLSHARAGRVCWRHAGSFTAAAIPGIAVGTLAAEAVSGAVLLAGFALVMLAAAHTTWRKADDPQPAGTCEGGGTCPPLRLRRDLIVGAAVGLVTGFFGVGGGFVIVPALVMFSGMGIHRAVATSLLVIAVISGAALASYAAAGQRLDAWTTGLFVAGGVIGLAAGTWVGRMVSPVQLQKVFSAVIVAVAVFVILKNLA